MTQSITASKMFDGDIRTLNVTLGINQNPTVVTATVIGSNVSVYNRQLVNMSLGSFSFAGIVQSWSQAKVDIAGTGVYQIRITDTKPVLDAAQIIIGSSFTDDKQRAETYGNNVITVLPQNTQQISDGIPFNLIKTAIERSTIYYGNQTYSVSLDFSIINRGQAIEYALKGRALSLLEFISQVASDHGLDWYVETNGTNIAIKIFTGYSRNLAINQLAGKHAGEIIRRHEGKENRDATQKVVLLGGYKTYLHRTEGDTWRPFWGFDSDGNERSEPVYSIEMMKTIVNSDFTAADYTEESAQKILSYANEFWGRKFISTLPSDDIDSDGKSWIIPTSAGWYELDSFPMNFNTDGRSKFQTNDGRWVTFATLPLPGTRPLAGTGGLELTFQWGDGLFSNPNTYIDSNNTISMKASLELMGSFFVLTLATPLRIKSITPTTALNPETELSETLNTITKTRLTTLGDAYLALLCQKRTYGPWSNRDNAKGRTEVIIDSSLTPWTFGYRGIINSVGLGLLERVARAKIKTVADTTTEVPIAELEVAGLPRDSLKDQSITSMNIAFGINGVRTIYKALKYTAGLASHVRRQQELLDKLRRQAAEFNNTMSPPKDDWALDKVIETLKKGLPEVSVDVPAEGSRRQLKTLLGRISDRSSTTQPKYDVTPMVWVSDAFGSLSLVKDPSVFGEYYNVVNMGEKQTTAGRLAIGIDVQVNEFVVTDGGITSYYIDMAAPSPPNFTATIEAMVDNGQPIYRVTPTANSVQQINLLASELIALDSVLNIGEPANYMGYLAVGAEVMIDWNENSDGSYTPFMEQQLNLFKPL